MSLTALAADSPSPVAVSMSKEPEFLRWVQNTRPASLAPTLLVLQCVLDRDCADKHPREAEALVRQVTGSQLLCTRPFVGQPLPTRCTAEQKEEDDLGFHPAEFEAVPDATRVSLLDALAWSQRPGDERTAYQDALHHAMRSALRSDAHLVDRLDVTMGYMRVALREWTKLDHNFGFDAEQRFDEQLEQLEAPENDQAMGADCLSLLGLLLLLQRAANEAVELDWDELVDSRQHPPTLAYLDERKQVPLFDLVIHMPGWRSLCLPHPFGEVQSVARDGRPALHLLLCNDRRYTALRARSAQYDPAGATFASSGTAAALSFVYRAWRTPVQTSSAVLPYYPSLLREMLQRLAAEPRTSRKGGLHVPGPVERQLRQSWWSANKVSVEDCAVTLEQASCILHQALTALLVAADDLSGDSARRRRSALLAIVLVFGAIQSGKTMSVEATIAKALDRRFRFVVIFSGHTEALRTQTQARLQESFPSDPNEPSRGRFVWLTGAARNTDIVNSLSKHALNNMYYDPDHNKVILDWKKVPGTRTLLLDEAYGKPGKESRQGPLYPWLTRTRSGVSGVESFMLRQPHSVLMMVVKKQRVVLQRLRQLLRGLPSQWKMLWIDDESDVGGVHQSHRVKVECQGENGRHCRDRHCEKCIAPTALEFGKTLGQGPFDEERHQRRLTSDAGAEREMHELDVSDDRAGESARSRASGGNAALNSATPPRGPMPGTLSPATAATTGLSVLVNRNGPCKTVAVNLLWRVFSHCKQYKPKQKKRQETLYDAWRELRTSLQKLIAQLDRVHAKRFKLSWTELETVLEGIIAAAAMSSTQRADLHECVNDQLYLAQNAEFNEGGLPDDVIDPVPVPVSVEVLSVTAVESRGPRGAVGLPSGAQGLRSPSSPDRSVDPPLSRSPSTRSMASASSLPSSSARPDEDNEYEGMDDLWSVENVEEESGIDDDGDGEDGDDGDVSDSEYEADNTADDTADDDIDDEEDDDGADEEKEDPDDIASDGDVTEALLGLRAGGAARGAAPPYLGGLGLGDGDGEGGGDDSGGSVCRRDWGVQPLDHIKLLVRYTATPTGNLEEDVSYGFLPQRLWLLERLTTNRSYLGGDFYFGNMDIMPTLYPPAQQDVRFDWRLRSALFSQDPADVRRLASTPLQCIPYSDVPNYAPLDRTAVLDLQLKLPPKFRLLQDEQTQKQPDMLPKLLYERAGWPVDKAAQNKERMMHFLERRNDQTRRPPIADEHMVDDDEAKSPEQRLESTVEWKVRSLPFSLIQACVHHVLSGGVRAWRSMQACVRLAAVAGDPEAQREQAEAASRGPTDAVSYHDDLRKCLSAIQARNKRVSNWRSEVEQFEQHSAEEGWPTDGCDKLKEPITSGLLPSAERGAAALGSSLLRLAEMTRCNVAFLAYGWLMAGDEEKAEDAASSQPQLFLLRRVNGDYGHNAPLRFIVVSRPKLTASARSTLAPATLQSHLVNWSKEGYHLLSDQSEEHQRLHAAYHAGRLPVYTSTREEAKPMDHAAMFHLHQRHKVMHLVADLVDQINYKIGLMLPHLFPRDSAGRALDPQRAPSDMLLHSLPHSVHARDLLRPTHGLDGDVIGLTRELDAQEALYKRFTQQFDRARLQYEQSGHWADEWLAIEQALHCQFRRMRERMALEGVPHHLTPAGIEDVVWHAEEQARNSVVRIMGVTSLVNREKWGYKWLHEKSLNVLDYRGEDNKIPLQQTLYNSRLSARIRGSRNRPELGKVVGVQRVPRSLLLIGGSMLARGITVDGLTTSYFCRSMNDDPQDSLQQMARWMGHNLDRRDLCTVFMQERAAKLFMTNNLSNQALLKEGEMMIRWDVPTDEVSFRFTTQIGTTEAFCRLTSKKAGRHEQLMRMVVTEICAPARDDERRQQNERSVDAFLTAIAPNHIRRARQRVAGRPTYVAHRLGMELYQAVPVEAVKQLLLAYQPADPATDRSARWLLHDLDSRRLDVRVGDELRPPAINVAVRDLPMQPLSALTSELPSPLSLDESGVGTRRVTDRVHAPFDSPCLADALVSDSRDASETVVDGETELNRARSWFFFDRKGEEKDEQWETDYSAVLQQQLRQQGAPLLLLLTRHRFGEPGTPALSLTSMALLHAATYAINTVNKTLPGPRGGVSIQMPNDHQAKRPRKVKQPALSEQAQAAASAIPRKSRHAKILPSLQVELQRRMAEVEQLSAQLQPYLPPISSAPVYAVLFNQVPLDSEVVRADVLECLRSLPTDATFARNPNDTRSVLYEPRLPPGLPGLPEALAQFEDPSLAETEGDARLPPSLYSIIQRLQRGDYSCLGKLWLDAKEIFESLRRKLPDGADQAWLTRLVPALKQRLLKLNTIKQAIEDVDARRAVQSAESAQASQQSRSKKRPRDDAAASASSEAAGVSSGASTPTHTHAIRSTRQRASRSTTPSSGKDERVD